MEKNKNLIFIGISKKGEIILTKDNKLYDTDKSKKSNFSRL